MATKLLKVGAQYKPNNNITASDGTKKNMPIIIFYFEADDSLMAKLIAANCGVKNMGTSGNAVIKNVPVDKYKNFLYGQGAFQKIVSKFEEYGFVFDQNSLPQIEQSVEKHIQDTVSSDAASKIYADKASFIDEIIKAMEENMNDPNFMSYVNAVGSIQYVGDDVLSKATRLSTKNTIMVLSQWVNAGNQGQPTFLATKRQWAEFFNRQPIPNATPLFFVRPRDTQGRSLRQTMSDYGVSQQKYDSDAMVRKQIDTLSHDKDFGTYNNSDFGIDNPYYDYSQTDLLPNAKDTYDFDGVGNINTDQDADADKSRGDLLTSAITSSNATSVDETTIITNLTNHAIKNGNNELQDVLKVGSPKTAIRRAVEYMAQNSDIILSENDTNKAKLYKNLIVTLALKRLRVDEEYSDKLMMNSMRELRTRYGGLNSKAFHAVSSDFQNIVYACYGITEEATPETLRWVMNTLGITPEEYRTMPKDEHEAEMRMNSVKESFVRTFNNILKHGKK